MAARHYGIFCYKMFKMVRQRPFIKKRPQKRRLFLKRPFVVTLRLSLFRSFHNFDFRWCCNKSFIYYLLFIYCLYNNDVIHINNHTDIDNDNENNYNTCYYY